MIRHLAIVVSVVLELAAGSIARAQTVVAPEPFLRAKLEPAGVTVGEMAVLTLEVLVPNFFATPPVVPDFQIRNAITRTLDRTNFAEQRDGATLAGIRYRFGLYPQEAGHYGVAGGMIKVSYADVPPNHRNVTLTVPPMSFDARVPDAASTLKPFIGSSELTVTQSVRQSSPDLKVGDSVVRTLVVTARDTPAMLLPPVKFSAADGVAVYPDQPVLSDQADTRSDALTGTRTDQATYMLQKAGDFVLPSIDIAWWRFGGDAIQHAHADAVTLHVADNPALHAKTPMTQVRGWDWRRGLDWLFEHWRAVLIAAGAAVAFAWIARRVLDICRTWYRRPRNAYLASETHAFAELRRAVRRGDAAKIYAALLGWLSHVDGLTPPHSMRGLKAAAQDVELDREIAALERGLFAAEASADGAPRALMRRLSRARRHLRMRGSKRADSSVLPASLNPQSGDREVWRRRAVAR